MTSGHVSRDLEEVSHAEIQGRGTAAPRPWARTCWYVLKMAGHSEGGGEEMRPERDQAGPAGP